MTMSPPSLSSSTSILCSTRLQPPLPDQAPQFARLVAQSEAEGVFLAGPWHAGAIAVLAAALAHEGLPLSALQLPLPLEPLRPDKRLPHWASADDPEERLAAVALVDAAVSSAQEVGATWGLLEAFPLALKVPLEAFVQAFGERRWRPEGERALAAMPLLEAAREERKAHQGRLADAARHALERLANVADRRQIRLAVAHGVGPWQYPSPRELDLLLQEFEGAPVFRAHLPARLDVLETLGLLTAERREALSQAPFVMASEAVGLIDDVLCGLGPKPLQTPLRQDGDRPPAVVVVSGRSDSRATEVRHALAVAKRLSLPSSTSSTAR